MLDADATIFKLIGPVLVKQDKSLAKENVEKRIGFIKTEIDRLAQQQEVVEAERCGRFSFLFFFVLFVSRYLVGCSCEIGIWFQGRMQEKIGRHG